MASGPAHPCHRTLNDDYHRTLYVIDAVILEEVKVGRKGGTRFVQLEGWWWQLPQCKDLHAMVQVVATCKRCSLARISSAPLRCCGMRGRLSAPDVPAEAFSLSMMPCAMGRCLVTVTQLYFYRSIVRGFWYCECMGVRRRRRRSLSL